MCRVLRGMIRQPVISRIKSDVAGKISGWISVQNRQLPTHAHNAVWRKVSIWWILTCCVFAKKTKFYGKSGAAAFSPNRNYPPSTPSLSQLTHMMAREGGRKGGCKHVRYIREFTKQLPLKTTIFLFNTDTFPNLKTGKYIFIEGITFSKNGRLLIVQYGTCVNLPCEDIACCTKFWRIYPKYF